MKRICALLLAAGLLMLAGCSGTEDDTSSLVIRTVENTTQNLTEGLDRETAKQMEEAINGDVTSQDLTEEESARLEELYDYIGTTAGTHLRERAELLGQEQPPRVTEDAARALCEGATSFSELLEAFVEHFGLPDLGMDYDKVYYEYWLLDQDESGLESIVLHRSWHRVIRMHADNSMEIWVDGLAE